MCPAEAIKIWRPLHDMSANLETVLSHKKSLSPYITFGDPHKSFTEELVLACFEAGADAVEIGIPFSDPVADGPVIQASHQRALAVDPDISLSQAFQLVQSLRKKTSKPLLFMSAVNLIFRFGPAAFFKKAAAVKLDGVIIPDLPVEEADVYVKEAKKHGVALVLLVSPLCTPDRLTRIVQSTSGFLYLMSSTGLTGERSSVSGSLSAFVRRIKKIRDIPVCVGFGISKQEHVRSVLAFAEGAIVGSFLVNLIHKHAENPQLAIKAVKDAVTDLKG